MKVAKDARLVDHEESVSFERGENASGPTVISLSRGGAKEPFLYIPGKCHVRNQIKSRLARNMDVSPS